MITISMQRVILLIICLSTPCLSVYSNKQYKYRFVLWHLENSISRADMSVAIRKMLKRKAEEGKESVISIHGREVPAAKIQRYMKNVESSEVTDCSMHNWLLIWHSYTPLHCIPHSSWHSSWSGCGEDWRVYANCIFETGDRANVSGTGRHFL